MQLKILLRNLIIVLFLFSLAFSFKKNYMNENNSKTSLIFDSHHKKIFNKIFNRDYNLISFEYQGWDGYEWYNSYKYIYEYDLLDNQIEYIYQTWSDDTWKNYFKTVSTYNDNNNLNKTLNYLWSEEDWSLAGQTTNYIYDEGDLDIASENDNLDLSYNLYQAYPNPFNPITTISFVIPKYNFVSIKVYTIYGSLVFTLVEDYFNQGNHSLIWDGTNLPSGQYLIKMESNNFNKTQIISLIK